jgi:hypothetical protein
MTDALTNSDAVYRPRNYRYCFLSPSSLRAVRLKMPMT